MGGGVWRIRQLNRNKFAAGLHNITVRNTSDLLAVAAMHNGFHIVDAKKCEVIASYTEEHKSLAYGLDLKDNNYNLQDSEDNVWVASCSFYDHILKLWKFRLE